MKLRLSLKSLVNNGLSLLIITCLVYGCSSSTTPTYLKQDIAEAIENICQKEYNIELKAKLVGGTLWIYIPIEESMSEKSDKPQKYSERFTVIYNEGEFKNGLLKVQYGIKPIPEAEKSQEYRYNKKFLEKVDNVWKVLRRVIFSTKDVQTKGPRFFYLITADIKNGLVLKELMYLTDLKKVSYQFISWSEYQHRNVQDVYVASEVIGDKKGLHIDYRDITFEEFILDQIRHRIKLKFQKPEVNKDADIDKEIIKIVVNTAKIYDFKEFSEVELYNLVTQSRTILNQAAIWARPTQ